MLWNTGQLPERWTLEKLMGKHPSHPFNPLLASAFFRAGYVESWGRGIEKMRRECVSHDVPAQIFDASMSGLMLTFKVNPVHLTAALGERLASVLLGLTGEVAPEVRLLRAMTSVALQTLSRRACRMKYTPSNRLPSTWSCRAWSFPGIARCATIRTWFNSLPD